MLKATAQTWFHTHRPVVTADAPNADLAVVDACFTVVLDATAKYAAKATYLNALKDAKAALILVRTRPSLLPSQNPLANTDDLAPDFSPWLAIRRCGISSLAGGTSVPNA